MTAPRVAIVIVTYQAERFLNDLFESLRAQTDLGSVHVVVVENASTDGTLAALRRIGPSIPRIDVLVQGENTGFARGNNIGIDHARRAGARYVLLLNPDTVVDRGWLEPLVATLDGNPRIAVAQPLLLVWSEPNRVNSAGNEIQFLGFGHCGGYGRVRAQVEAGSPIRPIAYASGAAMLVRLEAIDRVGAFDETLFAYQEDLDLGLRLHQAGLGSVLVTAARVWHKYNAVFTPRKYALLERNRWVVLLKRWPLPLLLACLAPLVATEVVLVLIAARAGWLRAKLRTYIEVASLLPEVLRDRRSTRRARIAHPEIEVFSGRLDFDGLEPAWVVGIGNFVLGAYWAALCTLLGAGRRSARRS